MDSRYKQRHGKEVEEEQNAGSDFGSFDGSYPSLTEKPTLFDGNYNSLTNKPSHLSKTNNIQDLKVVTQAEYDAITTKSATTIYFIK